MSKNIIPFNYNEKEVRVTIDESGVPWWMAKDVCEVLSVGNVTDAMSRLGKDEKTTFDSIEGAIGGPARWFVNEPGLYNLILTSKKPEAKPFKRWVTHEVLPQIRKTGVYAHPSAPMQFDSTVIGTFMRQVTKAAKDIAVIKEQFNMFVDQREEICSMMAGIEYQNRELAKAIREVKLPSPVPVPVHRFQHPDGTVRFFLIDGRPMILAADYLDVCSHKRQGYAVPNALTTLGFERNIDFTVRTLEEIALEYKAAPVHVKGQASLEGNSNRLTFITPKGMKKLEETDPVFYEWYVSDVFPHTYKLYEILAD